MEKNESHKIPLENLADISAGKSSSKSDSLIGIPITCPVPGCGFTCETFGELNIHTRNCHPERLRR